MIMDSTPGHGKTLIEGVEIKFKKTGGAFFTQGGLEGIFFTEFLDPAEGAEADHVGNPFVSQFPCLFGERVGPAFKRSVW